MDGSTPTSSGKTLKKTRRENYFIRKAAAAEKKLKPTFPVSDIHMQLAKGKNPNFVDPQVPIYLASAEEYIAHEILELAGNHCISRKSHIITVDDIREVIRNDPELDSLVGDAITKMYMKLWG